jgi:hypothetical protein
VRVGQGCVSRAVMVPSLKVSVVCSGPVPYAKWTLPSIEAYCDRNGYALDVRYGVEEDAAAKWRKYEATPPVLILDCDIFIRREAPPIHQFLDPGKLNIATQRRQAVAQAYLWERQAAINMGLPPWGTVFNAGVFYWPEAFRDDFWEIGREHRTWAKWEGDQVAVNFWAMSHPLHVAPLDARWNWLVHECHDISEAWFVHFAGSHDEVENLVGSLV